MQGLSFGADFKSVASFCYPHYLLRTSPPSIHCSLYTINFAPLSQSFVHQRVFKNSHNPHFKKVAKPTAIALLLPRVCQLPYAGRRTKFARGKSPDCLRILGVLIHVNLGGFSFNDSFSKRAVQMFVRNNG